MFGNICVIVCVCLCVSVMVGREVVRACAHDVRVIKTLYSCYRRYAERSAT